MYNQIRSSRVALAAITIIAITAATATASWTDYINPFVYFAAETIAENEAATPTQPAVFAGVTTNGGSGLALSYLTLADAITALNAATITSPVVITANGTEIAPAGGYNITQLGGTSANTITIDGGGATTITAGLQAAAGTAAAASFDAIFKISGGDYITIQGFTMNENAGNTVLTVGATNTMTEFGVLLIHASATDGASNNTIQNNSITLNAAYTNSVGIFSTSSSSPTTPFGALDATSTAGTNSNNRVYGNTISNVAQGIIFICPPVTATVFESGNDVGGTALATGNTVTFGNATASSGPWNRSQSTVQAGIYYRNGAAFNARFNSVTSTSLSYVGSGGLNGIMVSSGTAPTGVTYATTISNNTVGITSTGAALLTGIDFGHGISTGTITGSNNNVTVNQTSSAANSAASIGIKANYASASVTANTNTVVMNSSQSSGAMSGAITGITTAGVSSSTNSLSSNNVTINESTSATGTMSSTTIGITAAASATTSITADSNTITLNVSAVGGAITGSQTALNVGGATATNNVRLNTILFDQTTSIATGITTGAITGISATAAATTLNIGGTSNTNTITVKQAVTGAGTYGTNAVTFVNANATHSTANVKNNSFLTTGSTIRSTGSAIGVFQDSTVTTHVDIQNNAMTVDRVASSGFITFQSTSSTPSEVKDTISNNIITLTSLAGTTTATGISSLGGPGSPALNNKTIDGNTISISGTHSGTTIGITAAFTNTGFIRNNSITISCAAPTVNTITSTGTAMTVSGNTINVNSSSTSPTAMQGINLSGSGAHSVTNNPFSNLNFTGVITASPTVSGIALSGGTLANVFGNSITNISVGAAGSSGSPIVDGVLISGGAGVNVFKNKVYGITTAATGGTAVVSGIRISGGGVTNPNSIYNNLIGNLTAPAATSSVAIIPDSIRGINITSTTASSTNNVLFNSIYLNATSTGAIFGTSGVYHVTSTTATTSNLVLRNNNIVNISTPNGAGITSALTRAAGGPSTSANFSTTSNNNNYYAGTPAANRLIYNDNGAQFSTIALYKAGAIGSGTVAPRDTASFSESPSFLSTIGSNANFLHIDPTIATQIESGAANIAGITDDFDAQVRQGNGGYSGTGTAPDVGADEFNGIGIDLAGPSISYTNLSNTASTGDRVLAIAVTDATGVPTSGIGLPVLYYRKNAGTYFTSQCVFVSGSSYTCDIVAVALGGVAAADTISYYVVAQDTAGTPNVSVNPSAGAAGLTANPPDAATPPTTPNQYTIVPSITGTKTVGAGGDYSTLTAAIAAVNAAEVTGPVVLSLTDATYTTPAETFPLVLNANGGSSSTNTITIKPAVGVTSAITGSSASCVLTINGADYVTVDGSNAVGGTSRDLTVTNTNTGTTSAVVCLQNTAAPDGATNNVVKNVNVVGNSNTTTLFGVFSGSSTIALSSTGNGNNNNTIQNNNLSKSQYGIFSQGLSAGTKNTGNSITQNLINTPSPNNVSKGGIIAGFENSLTISQNTVSEVAQSSSPDVFGISLGIQGISTSTFTGNEVTNATVSRNIVGSIRNTGTFSACGICVAPATSGTNAIVNNSVYGVSANGTSGDFSVGVFIGGGTGSTTQIYYNSVSMSGTQTGGSDKSYALAIGGSNPTVDIRNNALSNTQSNGSGNNYALALGYSTFTNLTLNYNDYFTTTGATYFLGATGSISAPTNVSALPLVAGQDANSISTNPQFNSTTNLQPQTGSPLLLAATPIGGVTTDILGVTRNVTTPTIGAYENGIDTAGPSIVFTAFGNTSSTSSRSLSVTITDSSGVASGGLAPRIYQRKTPPGGGYSSLTCTGTSPNYTCDIESSIIGPFATGDLIEYFIVAQDTLGNVTVSPSAGAVATNVNTVTTPPTTPNSYTIVGTYSGPLNVGTTETITSLTNSGGLFAQINAGTVSGNVTVNLTSDLTAETGAVSLNQITEEGAGNWTVTIKPSGSPRVVSGSASGCLINLNGADRVVIDGAVSGTAKDMTISNTNTSGATVCFVNGAQNNTVKNSIVRGVSTSTSNGVIFFSTTTGVGNNTNTIQNNDLSSGATSAAYIVYNNGSGTAKNTNNVITQNRIFDFSNTGIFDAGNSATVTYSQNEIFQTSSRTTALTGFRPNATSIDGFTFTRNLIRNLTTSSTGTVYGIHLFDTSTLNTSLIANNMITLSETAPLTLKGIYDQTATGEKYNLYNNSVYIGGSVTGASNSEAYHWSIASTSDARNNIFVNARTGGTGKHYAYRTNTTLANLTSDYNDIYNTGGTGNVFGNNGTADVANLADWKLASPTGTGKDANSISQDPLFISTTDLHLSAVGLPLLGGGTTLPGVTVDYDNDPRPASNPDIGADEVVQAEGGVIPAGTFYNVSFNIGNTLAGNLTVNNRLYLFTVMDPGSSSITLGCNAVAVNASSLSYINGAVTKNYCGPENFTFPVGRGGFYSPANVDVTAVGVNPSSLTVTPHDALLVGFDPLETLSRNWQLDEVGDITANLQFFYDDSDVNGNESDYRMWRREGTGTDTNLCAGGPCVDTVNNILGPVNGVTVFSRWTGSKPLAPTSSAASVSGRVTTANGQGIRGAAIVITGNSLSTPIIAKTGSLGYFQINNLDSGQTYVVTVVSKRFTFPQPSRVINLTDSISDVDFIANPLE